MAFLSASAREGVDPSQNMRRSGRSLINIVHPDKNLYIYIYLYIDS